MREKIKQVVDHNNPAFNYMKLLEELAELTEVLIKRINKVEKYKPHMDKIVEEMGDVLLRMQILALSENIEELVNTRRDKKLEKLLEYIKNGEYPKNV